MNETDIKWSAAARAARQTEKKENPMSSTTKWLWVDVETTGLGYEPTATPKQSWLRRLVSKLIPALARKPYANRDDQILELAAIVTDPDLNELDVFEPVVVHASEKTLALMNDYVLNMHTTTGLLPKVRSSTTTLSDLDAALSAWLDEHEMVKGIKLSGNSVKLDFDFLRRNLPRTFGRLGYRVIDVSSFKETLREWKPEVVAELEAAKIPSHKAIEDIRWSVHELAFYKGHLGLGPAVTL